MTLAAKCLYIVMLLLVSAGPGASQTLEGGGPVRWWSDAVEAALNQATTNPQELAEVLKRVPETQREGLRFLIENMPERDLRSLSAEFILENLSLAYKAMEDAPWFKTVPRDLFFNDVLPYAVLTERRDNWRKRLYEICLPLVKDCRTPGEAGMTLNRTIFSLLKVRYSRQRRAPDQGPFETMETGLATCTGLAILLVDACRAVGVPARIAGTPLWSNHSGNHTWVEIWDGDWHFTGAAEPDSAGFDRGWFVGNASQSVKDEHDHGIYASSFRKTGLSFPIPWARRANYISAIDVTDRYAAKAKPPEETGLRLVVDVFNRPRGERVVAQVTVTDAAKPAVQFTGKSRGETADMNDHLSLQLPKARTYRIQAESEGQCAQQYFTAGTNAEDRLVIFLAGIPPIPAPALTNDVTQVISKPLSPSDEARLKEALTAFFVAQTNEQANWKFPRRLEKLLQENEPAVRRAAWEAFREAPIHGAERLEFDARQVRFEKHVSPYTVKTVGSRPAKGWGLVIAMHGGGGAPQELNDSQWKAMQRYYRDHPEVGGYIYVALRAPNNEWNGFYTGYVYPLVQNLIAQFVLFAEVDPNKVFLMGYSHGGYGAFAIGPKMPDRFAAIHASAAAPADGSSPVTLRNTVFSCMLGERDTMFGRYNLIQNFEKEVKKLRGERTDIYPVSIQIIANHPHSGLPDRDKIAEIYPAVRNPVPRELTWRLTDGVIREFFWLQVPAPAAGAQLDVTCQDNRVVATVTTNVAAACIFLDSRLIDFGKSVVLQFNGKTSRHRLRPSLQVFCATLQLRKDPDLAFSAQLPLPIISPGPTR